MLKEQVRKGFAAQGIPLMLRLLPGKVKSVGWIMCVAFYLSNTLF